LRVAGVLWGGLPGPSQDKALLRPAKPGGAPSESSALTSMCAEIGLGHKSAFAPIDKVEPTVDTAGP
jgi:hypothetical protein